VKLCVVAGEASGDLHGAELVRELRLLDPRLELFGFGGDRLAAQGMRILHHARELGIVGLFNVLRHVSMFRRVFRELVEEIRRERPDAVLLIDYPEFNLRLAKQCRRLGVKVIYYISPQIWAWRQGRVRSIWRNVDHMIVIFPFEESFYADRDVPTTYVGHPLVEQLEGLHAPASLPEPGEALRLALMPGSRRMEVASLLPPMLEAVHLLARTRAVDAYIIQAPTIDRALIDSALKKRPAEVRVVGHEGEKHLAEAHLALSSSGTATLECAIIGVPVVVMYRLTPGTYWLAKRLVRLPYFSLVNIVARKGVVPELIQNEVRGDRLAEAAETLLRPETYYAVKSELARVRSLLGESGSSSRAAQRVWTLMNG
jgi:lipid-A-disaccharide synthase